MKECLVIIPAFNEEHNIKKVLKEILEAGLDIDILVVNDGSTDRTQSAAGAAGKVKIVSLPFNLGYGNALQTGFKYAVANGYQYVIQFDADGQHDTDDLRVILSMLKSERADIIIGSRFLGRSTYKVGFLKKTAIYIFRFLIRISTGIKITDPSSGLQGLTYRVFEYYAQMGNFPPDYPDADILIQMILSKYRVCEFPANIRVRNHGAGMHAGLKPVFYIIKMMVSIIVVLLRPRSMEGRWADGKYS